MRAKDGEGGRTRSRLPITLSRVSSMSRVTCDIRSAQLPPQSRLVAGGSSLLFTYLVYLVDTAGTLYIFELSNTDFCLVNSIQQLEVYLVQAMTFLSLPVELQELILVSLDPKDLLVVSCASKHARNVAERQLLSEVTVTRSESLVQFVAGLTAEMAAYIKTLKFGRCGATPQVTDANVDASHARLVQLAAPHLRTLQVSAVGRAFDHVYPHLRRLLIVGQLHDLPSALPPFLAQHPALHVLRMDPDVPVGFGYHKPTLPPSEAPALQTLECSLDWASAFLASTPTTVSLHITNPSTQSIENATLKLAQAPFSQHLQSLHLAGGSHHTRQSLETFVRHAPALVEVTITSLLSSLDLLRLPALLYILSGAPHLLRFAFDVVPRSPRRRYRHGLPPPPPPVPDQLALDRLPALVCFDLPWARYRRVPSGCLAIISPSPTTAPPPGDRCPNHWDAWEEVWGLDSEDPAYRFSERE
ncbi:hypothetical protein DFH06DRAFT_433926 [Mycena polygramma]|nr:hypothetical protein DFH06DRAFT_433926 [Mycena polygramma]